MIRILIALATPESRVSVFCSNDGGSEVCTVEHISGGPAKACWDVVYHCANGVTVRGSACQTVNPSQKTTRVIAETELQNLAACDRATSHEVTNMKMTSP